jgi:transposase
MHARKHSLTTSSVLPIKKGKFSPTGAVGLQNETKAPIRYANWWNYNTKVLSNQFPVPQSRALTRVHINDQYLSHQTNRCWIPKDQVAQLTDASQNPQKKYVFVQGGIQTHDNELQKKRSKTQHTHNRTKSDLAKNKVHRTWKLRVEPTPTQKLFYHQAFKMSNLAQKECLFALHKQLQLDLENKDVDAEQPMVFSDNVTTKKEFRQFHEFRINNEVELELVMKRLNYQLLMKNLLNRNVNSRASRLHPHFFQHELCPYDSKAEAIHSVCVNITSRHRYICAINQSRMINKSDPVPIRMKFAVQNRNNPVQSVFIKTSSETYTVKWDDEGLVFWASKKLGNLLPWSKRDFERMQIRLGRSGCITMRAVLKYTQPGRYYILLPYISQTSKNPTHPTAKQGIEKSIVALDPGCKTFQAGYDNSGLFMEFGKAAGKRLLRIAIQMDKIKKQRIITHSSGLNQLYGRLRLKLADLRNDMHCKLACDLTNRYSDILIPELQVGQMIHAKKLPLMVLKQLQLLRHHEFRNRLMQKAEMNSCKVYIVSEHQTSMACGACGQLFETLGGSRNFHCSGCNYRFDRDLSAARNIFLMNVTQYCGQVQEKRAAGEKII